MEGTSVTDTRSFNEQVIEEFRANKGVVGGMFAGAPLLLLTSTGAKSGQPRVTPLAYTRDANRFVVIASKGGAPTHPDWYFNLKNNPVVTVEVGTEVFTAQAREETGDERQRLFDQMAAQMPNFAQYQAGTDRIIPLFTLTPQTAPE
jgi:deazaflavin-dependent oxidoreductase (nitroreductase family)